MQMTRLKEDSHAITPPSLAVFGDSVLKGVVFDPVANRHAIIEASVPAVLARETGRRVDNQSKFGITSDKALVRLESYLKKLDGSTRPDEILIEIGGNDSNYRWDEIASSPHDEHDAYVSLSDYEKNIRAMIRDIREAGIAPLVMSLPPIDGERYYDFLSRTLDGASLLTWLGDVRTIYRHQEMYSLTLSRIALEEGVPFLDVRSPLLALHSLRPFMCEDGLHYTEAGQALLARILAEKLQESEKNAHEC